MGNHGHDDHFFKTLKRNEEIKLAEICCTRFSYTDEPPTYANILDFIRHSQWGNDISQERFAAMVLNVYRNANS